MGFSDYGPLNDGKHSLIESLSHINRYISRDAIAMGYDINNHSPIYDQELHTPNDSKNKTKPTATTTLEDEDVCPSTSILWGEDEPNNDHSAEASISREIEFYDSHAEDPNREWIRLNVVFLMDHDQSAYSNAYEWEYLFITSHELAVDIIHAYANQIDVVD